MDLESVRDRDEEKELFDSLSLMAFSNLFMREVSDNVYELDISTKFSWLGSLYEVLKKKIIKRKDEIGSTDIELDANDVFMVRSMNQLPEDLCYRSLSHVGAAFRLANPFFGDHFLSGLDSSVEEFRIVTPFYRDTVHFALNGLVSNTIRTNVFTNRGCVVIEPLIDHLNDKLVNLNPVDTMIDVGDEDEKIGKNAVFIISKEYYEKLSDEERNQLKDHKVILFDGKRVAQGVGQESSPLQVVTDFVLCSMGVIPQHSVAQSVMHVESYQDFDYSTFTVKDSRSDQEYLRKFNDLMERLNMEYLGVSYYNLPPEIAKYRRFGRLGYFHCDLPQWDEEVENNRKIFKDTFKRYMEFLKERIDFPDEFLEKAFAKHYNYIDMLCDNYGTRLGFGTSLEKSMWEPYTSIEEIKRLTKEFNEREMERLASIREKYRMTQQMQEEESDVIAASKK